MATSKRSSSGYFLLIDGEGKTDKASMRHIGENAFKTAHPKFQKTIYFCFVDYAKAFDCVDRHKLENSRDGYTRPPYLLPEKSVCRSGSRSLNWTWNKTGFKLEKEYIKAVYFHPAYLTSMQSTS